MKHYIGIDNANLSHEATILNDLDVVIEQFNFENNAAGFATLLNRLEKYQVEAIGFELPHGPLIDFLRNSSFSLYCLNPLKVKRFKEVLSVSKDKNDKIDSIAIARYLKTNLKHLKSIVFNSSQVEEVKVLSLSYDRLLKEKVRYSNRLLFIIRNYFPLLEHLFSDITCKTALSMLIRFPTWATLQNIEESEMRTFLANCKYRDTKRIEKLLDQIVNYEHVVHPSTETALSLEAQTLAQLLLLLVQRLEVYKRRIAAITKQHQVGKVLLTIPGAGNLLAGKLLGILGDAPERFSNAKEMQSLFGTAPVNYQSGPYQRVIMRRACNKVARSILFQFAFCTIKHSEWARKYYDAQREKGKKHSVAVRALSNKWLRIIFIIWQKQEIYQENLKLA